jgi:Protein of unknown function (DUF3102)
MEAGGMTITLEQSNSLTDLAASIRAVHEACSVATKRGLHHAVAAGKLLIEAKAQLKHGQWLPWLREHCQSRSFTKWQLHPMRGENIRMAQARHRAQLPDMVRVLLWSPDENEADAEMPPLSLPNTHLNNLN